MRMPSNSNALDLSTSPGPSKMITQEEVDFDHIF